LIKTPKLLIATSNLGKVKEYQALLSQLPFELTTLAEQGIAVEAEEGGSSLEQNAAAKATRYAEISQFTTLADDSGLEVDALRGEPGPLSARYAGEGASDRERIDYLLAKLSDVPWERRSARFRCVIAIATPSGEVELCQGECEGFIAYEPKGGGGFGYDPIFYLPELGKTMAELSFEEKNKVSHRGKAARKAHQLLMKQFMRIE
jgi:XTP/dITP diphosphohydrolase